MSSDGKNDPPAEVPLRDEAPGGWHAERARLRAALELRDETLAIALHELRSPVTVLLAQLQLGLQGCAEPASGGLDRGRLREQLRGAEQQVRRIQKLLESLFDVTECDAGPRRERVELAALTQEVVRRLAATTEVKLHVDAAPVEGEWDRLRLERVVTNLVENALKYGAGRPILVSLRRDGERARLVVTDQGIGVAPEDQARIFERFARAEPGGRYDGRGLGLYIVRRIVETMGGTVEVQSERGRGAAFRVQLPLRPPGA